MGRYDLDLPSPHCLLETATPSKQLSHQDGVGAFDTAVVFQALASGFATSLKVTPKNPVDFKTRCKDQSTRIVEQVFATLGSRFGMQTLHNGRVEPSKCRGPFPESEPHIWKFLGQAGRSRRIREYDFTWTRGPNLHLVAESEWYWPIEKILFDFQKLLHANARMKVLIHRRSNSYITNGGKNKQVLGLLPALIDSMVRYRHHAEGETYVIVQATDYCGYTLGHSFSVPKTEGRLHPDDIAFQAIPGSPFSWNA